VRACVRACVCGYKPVCQHCNNVVVCLFVCLSSRHDTILTTTTPSPYCFYCSVHDTGPTRCLSRHYVCDGVNDCWDKSDERNCTMSPG